ncbi:MAG: Xanthine/uracil/thiamine/ascorbate permease family protein [Myxococcaceae bacterium]|nr:Xanthine/uracil/thiamine/ascorbate permease family protein [Myxococcaceae bacterium]
MRRVRILLHATTIAGVFVLALAPGCRDATQATIDISLTKLAHCTETNGTAITVGVDPTATEDRVAHEFVTATTSACDPATGEIGTLVLTPSSGHASVIVVVAYDKVSPASCKPPLYKGCIVARRQFSFTDHRHITMPISIDPDCKDVPCDAFSTCRTGKCFSADVACTGDNCLQPGDPGDGGTALDAEVIPDTGIPIEGSVDGSMDGAATDSSTGTDGSSDAGTDADDSGSDAGGVDGSVPDGVYCDVNGNLLCPAPTVCNTGSAGCQTATGPLCRPAFTACMAGETQYCCANAPCPVGKACLFSQVVGPPGPGVIPNPVDSTKPGTCH